MEASSQRTDWSLLRCHFPLIAMTQLPCLIIAAMLLDGGISLRVCLIAAISHWTAIAMIVQRNRLAAGNALDTTLVRWGYFGWLILTAGVAALLS